MKERIEFSGDFFEDKDVFKMIVLLFKMIVLIYDMKVAIHDAKKAIRSRQKYGEDVSDQEEKTLEKIIELLYIEGLE